VTQRALAEVDADDGSRDLARAIDRLARRLPEPLQPLAEIAYNYEWSWTPGGRELFRALGAHRFGLSNENPVRFLRDLAEPELLAAATDAAYIERIGKVAAAISSSPTRVHESTGDDLVAFLCAEFGVHRSLPVYSGGLGVLAGDLLKEASDQALPFVGVGLLYRRGYFHQRVDRSGWQQEYWIESDPNAMPAVRVTTGDGQPLAITIPLWDGELVAHVWRVQVGRVPLYLLDTEIGENAPLERWVTARLYEGNRTIRLAQYALLGVGAVRALTAMGVTPSTYHLNEGHAALATLAVASSQSLDSAAHAVNCADAVERTRDSFVFTTHTPVPAGNETYASDEVMSVLGRLFTELNFDPHEVLALGRIHPDNAGEHTGLTPLAIRGSRSTNAVSLRHGVVARSMWHEMFPLGSTDDVPITHVTNAVHLPTWMSPPMRRLLTDCFGEGWERHASDPAMWKQVDALEDGDLWSVRNEQRENLVYQVRRKVTVDRLARGEDIDFVEAGQDAFDPHYLTLGFARRLATYKRLNLLVHNAERALSLLDHDTPIQLVFAGKAHPQDDAAKAFAQRMFDLKRVPEVGNKVVFLEDYDLSSAAHVVGGCDVWLNLPRPPYEASGTSGMKAAMNGCLNLSVLDGWWMEAYDGTNGWAIDGGVDPDEGAKDERDANAFYDLLDEQVKPLFYERNEHGVPVRWLEMVRASLKTLAPRYCATRMLDDYVEHVYGR
jgi:starch phosphorylase